MHTIMTWLGRRCLAWAVLAATAGCSGELEHASKFDPQTPRDNQARATVSGRFTLEGEEDHAGVEIRLNGPSIKDISTQADGTFAVNELIPGNYTLTIGERGWEEVTREVVLDIGDVAALLSEELPLRTSAVAGSLISADGKDIDFSGSKITVTRTGTPRSTGGANSPGGFAPGFIPALLTDKYSLKFLIEDDNSFFFPRMESGEWEVQVQTLLPGSDGCGEYRDYALTVACRKAFDEAQSRLDDADSGHSPARLAPAQAFTIELTGEDGVFEVPPFKIALLSGDLAVRGTLADGVTESQTYSATRSVKLLLTAANAFKMILGEGDISGECLYGEVVDFEVAPVVELSAGDGTKTVCVILVNEDASQTLVLKRSIVLDTTAPTLSLVRINAGQAYSTVNTVPFELIAFDYQSGLEKIARTRNSTDIGTIDYVPVFSDTLTADGIFTYTLQVIDRAGHASAAMTESVTLDREAPTGLAVTINAGAVKTSERLLELELDPGDADQIQLGLDAAFGGVSWQAATSSTQMYISRADGTITVFMRGRDGADNISEVVSSNIILDTTPPDAVAIALADIDEDGFPLTHEVAELSWSASVDPNAVEYELQRYVIGNSTAFETVTTTTVGTESFADDITATAGRVHQYRVRVLDTLGQASQWSNVLAVNTMAADGQLCWVANQTDGSDIAYTQVPPTGAISSQATSSLLDMLVNDNEVVQTFPENSLSMSQARRALDVGEAGFTMVSTNLDSVYRQQGKVDAPMGWHWDVVDRTSNYIQDVKVRLDAAGNVHILYADTGSLKYAARIDGAWLSPMVLVPSDVFIFQAEIDADGALHVAYVDYAAGKLNYLTNRTGSWAATVELATGSLGTWTALRLDRQQQLHVAFTDGSVLRYSKTTGGIWSAAEDVTTAGAVNNRAFGLDVDSQGAVHISYQGSDRMFRYVNSVGGGWNAYVQPEGMLIMNDYNAEKTFLRVDAADNVHIIEYNGDPAGAAKKHWTNAGGSWASVIIESGWDSLGLEVPAYLDKIGTLHLIDRKDGNNLIYRTRTSAGAWSPNTVINPSQPIGQFFDVVADEQRDAHLVYVANKELRYVTNAGSARNTRQDLLSGNPHAVSMVIDSKGIAHGVYADFQKLWYHNNAGGVWTTRAELADTSEFPAHAALAIDPADQLHIVYPSYSLQSLRYKYWNGVTWSAPVSLDPVIGYSSEMPSIQAGADGTLYIAYFDDVSDDLRYVQGSPGNWSTPVTLDATGDTGHFISLAVGKDGAVHVAYLDKTSGMVKYLRRAGAAWDIPVVVAPGYFEYARNPISMGVDSQGVVHITFFGLLDTGLKYVNNRNGSFGTPIVLDVINGNAGGSSLAVDSHDRIQVFYFSGGVAKYIWHTGRRWMAPVVIHSGLDDFFGDVGGFPTLALDRNDRAHTTVFDGGPFKSWYKFLGNEVGCSEFSGLKPISPF